MANARATGPLGRLDLRWVLLAGPPVLATHGVLVLAAQGGEPWQWLVVIGFGLSGLLRTGRFRHSRRWGYGQGVATVVASMALVWSTGGAESRFSVWLIASAAVIPVFVGIAPGVIVGVALAGFYGTFALTDGVPLDWVLYFERMALLIGAAAAAVVFKATRRSAVVSDRRLAQLFLACPAALFAVDGNGTIMVANDKAEQMFGYRAAELVGRPLEVLVPERYRKAHRVHLAAFAAGPVGRRRMSERPVLLGLRSDGTEFPVEIGIAKADDGLLSATVSDMTDWEVAQRQLREHGEALQRLMLSKDRLIASVAHEIRTPLTEVLGFLEAIRGGAVVSPDEIPEFVDRIVRRATDLGHIVDDLLVAARAELGDPVIVLASMDVASEVKAALVGAGWGQVPVMQSHPGIMCLGDARRFRQVVRGLVSNAVRHGGPEVGVEVSTLDDSVLVAVSDNGPGLPEGAEGRVFERYESVNPQPGLTEPLGIGLGVCRDLTVLMGGQLAYRRTRGTTTFTISLPAAG